MVTQGLEGKVGLYQGSETFLVCNGDGHVDDWIRQHSPWTIMFMDAIVICRASREQVEKSPER